MAGCFAAGVQRGRARNARLTKGGAEALACRVFQSLPSERLEASKRQEPLGAVEARLWFPEPGNLWEAGLKPLATLEPVTNPTATGDTLAPMATTLANPLPAATLATPWPPGTPPAPWHPW